MWFYHFYLTFVRSHKYISHWISRICYLSVQQPNSLGEEAIAHPAGAGFDALICPPRGLHRAKQFVGRVRSVLHNAGGFLQAWPRQGEEALWWSSLLSLLSFVASTNQLHYSSQIWWFAGQEPSSAPTEWRDEVLCVGSTFGSELFCQCLVSKTCFISQQAASTHSLLPCGHHCWSAVTSAAIWFVFMDQFLRTQIV